MHEEREAERSAGFLNSFLERLLRIFSRMCTVLANTTAETFHVEVDEEGLTNFVQLIQSTDNLKSMVGIFGTRAVHLAAHDLLAHGFTAEEICGIQQPCGNTKKSRNPNAAL